MQDVARLLALHPMSWVGTYGYWAVFFFVAIESAGIPVPGEATLVSVAAYAGVTHHLDIGWVIAAAAGGAVIGDNLGYLIGRRLGFPLLVRHGRAIGLGERRLKLGQYLFGRYGGTIVFVARFVSVLRAVAAVLAGVNCLPWRRFLVCNASGAVVWATLFGLGGYLFGGSILHRSGWITLIFGAVAAVAMIAAWLFIRSQEERLSEEAERALPGPLRPDPARPDPSRAGSA